MRMGIENCVCAKEGANREQGLKGDTLSSCSKWHRPTRWRQSTWLSLFILCLCVVPTLIQYLTDGYLIRFLSIHLLCSNVFENYLGSSHWLVSPTPEAKPSIYHSRSRMLCISHYFPFSKTTYTECLAPNSIKMNNYRRAARFELAN